MIERFEDVCTLSPIDLALDLLERLLAKGTPFIVDLGDDGSMFSVFVELRFLNEVVSGYQMRTPTEYTMSTIKSSLKRLAATEDESGFFHPERLLMSMTQEEVVDAEAISN